MLMISAIVIFSVINITVGIYFIVQGMKNKLSAGKIAKILTYNAAQFVFCILLYRAWRQTEQPVVVISCIVCLVLQSLSFIPLKIMFDRIIDKLSIEEEYEFLLKKEEIDKKYFEMMKEHEEHVARIRHDFINQVAVAGNMVADTDSSAVGYKLLDELREEVESTRTTVYCSNKMINIVVDVMHYQYAEKGIKLNADIVLPTILYLDEMKICSIIQTMLNECLSILSLAQMENPKVDFQIKKVDGKIMFMARCPVENIREHKKCERIIRTNEKYFHRILEEQESGVYNRMNKGAVEIVVSVKDQNGI